MAKTAASGATTDGLIHEEFCLPRPGMTAPRIERYPFTKYADNGITPVGVVDVERCQECGAAAYDGQRPAQVTWVNGQRRVG